MQIACFSSSICPLILTFIRGSCLPQGLWRFHGNILSLIPFTFNWNSSLRNICPFTPNYFLFNLFLPIWIYCTLWFIIQCHCYLFSCPDHLSFGHCEHSWLGSCVLWCAPSFSDRPITFSAPQCAQVICALPALILKSPSSLRIFGFLLSDSGI